MWQRIAIFTWAALVFIIIGYFWQVTTTEATTTNLRPVSDGAITQWMPTPSGNHYATVDEVISQPTAGDTTDYISVPGTGDDGDERDELNFNNVDGEISQVVVWLYSQNVQCQGNGNNVCDKLNLSLFDKTAQNITISTGSYSWISATFDFSIAPEGNFVLKIDRQTRGAGDNNDEIRIAAIYLEVTHTEPTKSGGKKDDENKEKGKSDDPAIHDATDSGGKKDDENKEKGELDDSPIHNATDAGGGGGGSGGF